MVKKQTIRAGNVPQCLITEWGKTMSLLPLQQHFYWNLLSRPCDIGQTPTRAEEADKQDFKKITSLAEVTNREGSSEIREEEERRRERERAAERSSSGGCFSYHSAAMFVYFLSGVNIYAWLQPSHLHMSPLCTITQTLGAKHARTHIFLSLPALILRLSQYSPSSHILT